MAILSKFSCEKYRIQLSVSKTVLIYSILSNKENVFTVTFSQLDFNSKFFHYLTFFLRHLKFRVGIQEQSQKLPLLKSSRLHKSKAVSLFYIFSKQICQLLQSEQLKCFYIQRQGFLHNEMAIQLKLHKLDNCESHKSLKLSLTNIQGLHSIFVG